MGRNSPIAVHDDRATQGILTCPQLTQELFFPSPAAVECLDQEKPLWGTGLRSGKRLLQHRDVSIDAAQMREDRDPLTLHLGAGVEGHLP